MVYISKSPVSLHHLLKTEDSWELRRAWISVVSSSKVKVPLHLSSQKMTFLRLSQGSRSCSFYLHHFRRTPTGPVAVQNQGGFHGLDQREFSRVLPQSELLCKVAFSQLLSGARLLISVIKPLIWAHFDDSRGQQNIFASVSNATWQMVNELIRR